MVTALNRTRDFRHHEGWTVGGLENTPEAFRGPNSTSNTSEFVQEHAKKTKLYKAKAVLMQHLGGNIRCCNVGGAGVCYYMV